MDIYEYDNRSLEVKGSLDTTLNELNALSQNSESGNEGLDNEKGEI